MRGGQFLLSAIPCSIEAPFVPQPGPLAPSPAEQTCGVAKLAFERGHTQGGVLKCVMCKLDPNQVSDPCCQIRGGQAMEGTNQVLLLPSLSDHLTWAETLMRGWKRHLLGSKRPSKTS